MFINVTYLSGLHTCHVAFQGPVQGSNLEHPFQITINIKKFS